MYKFTELIVGVIFLLASGFIFTAGEIVFWYRKTKLESSLTGEALNTLSSNVNPLYNIFIYIFLVLGIYFIIRYIKEKARR